MPLYLKRAVPPQVKSSQFIDLFSVRRFLSLQNLESLTRALKLPPPALHPCLTAKNGTPPADGRKRAVCLPFFPSRAAGTGSF